MKKGTGTIVITGSTGMEEPFYQCAKEAIKGTRAHLTTLSSRAAQYIKKGMIKKVIVIRGDRDITCSNTIYSKLKKYNNKTKFVLLDGFSWPVKKKDKMIFLPVSNMVKVIQDNL